MKSLFEPSKEVAQHERAISSLHVRTGAPLVEVRRLFAQEFSRLELDAKVRSYLAVLTVSKVRAIVAAERRVVKRRSGELRRKGS